MSDHEQAISRPDEWRPSDPVEGEPPTQPLGEQEGSDTPASSILPVEEADVADAPAEGSPATGATRDTEWRPSDE